MPLLDSLLTRRQAIARFASAAALPLMSACNREPGATGAPAASSASSDAAARALLDGIGDRLLRADARGGHVARHRHRRASGAAFAAHGSLGGRTAAHRESVARAISIARTRSTPPGLSHATRTSVEVVRSAYATALEGFALPYGDMTVGSWRNTPYVVIQNVGAYLDMPRLLDSRPPHRERRRRRGVSGPAAVVREAARRRARPHPGGAREGARAAGVPDRQGARADCVCRSKNAREGGSLVESIERRTKNIPGNWAERARTIAAQEIAPALERQIAELQAQRAVADRRCRHVGAAARRRVLPLGAEGVDDDDDVARRDPRDGPARARASCTRGWTTILKTLGYTQRHASASACRRSPRTRTTSSPKATRGAPRSWRSSRIASTGSARRCRAPSTRSSIRTWK